MDKGSIVLPAASAVSSRYAASWLLPLGRHLHFPGSSARRGRHAPRGLRGQPGQEVSLAQDPLPEQGLIYARYLAAGQALAQAPTIMSLARKRGIAVLPVI